jgi:tetratricopeptide (TPR) repeat protein
MIPTAMPRRRTGAVLGACALLAVAHVAAWTPWGQPVLWGLHHAAFLPTWTQMVLVALMVAGLVPSVARAVSDTAVAVGSRLARVHRLAPLLSVCVAAVGLFTGWPIAHGLLGDAGPRLAEVASSDFSFLYRLHSNDTWVRHLLHHAVGVRLGWSAAESYALLSQAWGVVLVVAAWKASALLASPGSAASRLALFAPVVTSAFVLLYCGYIEVYSSVTALGVIFVLLSTRYALGQGGLWLPVLSLLAVGVHHVLGLLAAPALAVAFVHRHDLDRRLPASWRRRLTWVTVVVASLAYWGAFLWVRPVSAVPMFAPVAHIPYTILSPAHLGDVANFHLLSATVAWAAVVAAWGIGPSAGTPDRRTQPLYAAAGTTFVLMFIVNPGLGRLDWDLMAMHAPIWVLAALCHVESKLRDRQAEMRYAAGALLALGLFHTVPWLALNQFPDRAVGAIEAMVATDAHLAGGRAMKLGVLFEQLGFLDAARRQFERDLSHDPRSMRALYNLGNVYHKRGDLQTAANLYERALAIDASESRTWNNLGSIRLRQGQLQEAVSCLEQAVRLDPDFAGPHSNLGGAYFDLGRYAEALRAYTRAAELQPSLEHLFFNVGVSHTRLGDFEAAAAALERFVRLQPHSAEGFLQLGNSYARTGDRPRARAALTRFLELAGGDHPYRSRARRYVEQTDPDGE